MLGLGRVTCDLCKARVSKRHARRGQDARRACVCDSCFTGWEREGKKCAECKTPVRGMQDPGIFGDGKGLGHSDCGGARLLRA
jgi:hypothetical protein